MTAGQINVHRPRAIVFDILGTATKSGFLERILFPFLRLNLETYLKTHWDKHDFIKLYKRVQEVSIEMNRNEPSTPIVLAHKDGQAKQSLMNFLNYCLDNGLQPPPVTQLRFKVWFEGYQTARLLTPIYSDVPTSLRRWFAEGIKFYVFSNTWVEAQKALLRNTTHGDLTNLITGNFDNEFGLLSEVDSWRRFCNQIKETPNNVLFLTKSPLEARAAQDAGLQVVLVLTHRHNVKAVGHDDRHRFPYVRTLHDLHWIEGSMLPTSGGAGPSATSGATAAASTATSGAPSGTGASATGIVSSRSGATSNQSRSTARAVASGLPPTASSEATGQPPSEG